MKKKTTKTFMKKKTARNVTVEETHLFYSILTDPVTKFMPTLERKALKKVPSIWGNSRGIKNYLYERTFQNFKCKVPERQKITESRDKKAPKKHNSLK